MNILPKKRWHVRTKANIARVRKDEAEAKEAEEKEKRRSQISEREAKINYLRKKNLKNHTPGVPLEISEGLLGNLDDALVARNKEHDEEEKQIKEDYEKKIGLLSYLAKKEDSAAKPWYLELRNEKKEHKDHSKFHSAKDPLNDMKKFVSLKERSKATCKPPRTVNPKTTQGKSIEELRAIRLQRERKEREREKQMLMKHCPT